MLVSHKERLTLCYFGNNAGLDFNSGSPIALTDGQLYIREGCAVLSNNLGQLLFYDFQKNSKAQIMKMPM